MYTYNPTDDYRLTACMSIVKVAVRQHILPEKKSNDDKDFVDQNEVIT